MLPKTQHTPLSSDNNYTQPPIPRTPSTLSYIPEDQTSIADKEWFCNIGPYTEQNFKTHVKGNVNHQELLALLRLKGAILLTGAPGKGKTHLARHLASLYIGFESGDSIGFLSINATTDYADTIAGLRPIDGDWQMVDGHIQRIAKLAQRHPSQEFVLILDELNRGNTEAILGEVMTAMEARGIPVKTNGGGTLTIPANLKFIATMNSLDGSAKRLDEATYARFAVVDLNQMACQDTASLQPNMPEPLRLKYLEITRLVEQVNKVLVQDKFKGLDNSLGIRELSVPIQSLQDLRLVVKYSLFPTILRRMTTLPLDLQAQIKGQLQEMTETVEGDDG